MADITYASSHAGICVSDIDRSMRFYCDGLGFQPAERYDLDSTQMPGLDRSLEVDGPLTLISQMIVSGGMKIELLAYPDRSTQGTPSTTGVSGPTMPRT